MVALRSFQQLNVTQYRWRWVLPTSFGMAACDAVLVVKLASGWRTEQVFVYGLSAGLGCLSAMWVHRQLAREKK